MNKINNVLLCLTFCLTCFGKDLPIVRVVGGKEAEKYYGKFHVSLQNVDGEHVCGGAVISNRHVLTAAHCFQDVTNPDLIRIIIGTIDLDKGGKKYKTESFMVHEDYDYELKINDIAIVRAKKYFDPRIAKSLSISQKQLETGEFVCLSGFGAMQPDGGSTRILHAIDLPVFDQETCKYAMRYTRNVTDSMFCTFTEIGQGTCYGDSGGPLIRNNEIVGLVSWGIPCAVGYPDVHTRIAPYIEWIRNKLNLYNDKYVGTSTKLKYFL